MSESWSLGDRPGPALGDASWDARALSPVHLFQASQEVSVLSLSAYDCDFFNKGKLSLESWGIAVCVLVPQHQSS